MTIFAKLGNMRKAVEWTVYPRKDGERVVIQSNARIASFDPVTGAGLLSKGVASGAYFLHLLPAMGATPVSVPADVLSAALGAVPQSGQQIGPGVFVL